MGRSISIRDRKIKASIEVEEAQCTRLIIRCTTKDAVRKAQEPLVRISTNFTQALSCVMAWECPCENRNGKARAEAAIIIFGGEQLKSEVLEAERPIIDNFEQQHFQASRGKKQKREHHRTFLRRLYRTQAQSMNESEYSALPIRIVER